MNRINYLLVLVAIVAVFASLATTSNASPTMPESKTATTEEEGVNMCKGLNALLEW
ncbi:hypothetical protein DFA_02515 [Cavenderia fasciculata]|uniref:Uncharacterized protein n=1 Tax=Cavenderia fasciculata TaxID=261658 RepID=F4PZL2_CACFS|nr:uncharacterized protein DFA_02515 [Cavenderia fasciculata]EGG18776.1 hypothetical protein DFA_02515 [Cavenderia fasciculata]|eukprot:XP_004357238.1 hypothetical protein DFA_02515 [Cavenderia fasciculata]